MSNPFLSDAKLAKAAADGSGWSAPTMRPGACVSAESRDRMTVNGVATAAGVLGVILFVAAAFGWSRVVVSDGEVVAFPMWSIIAMLVGFGAAVAANFKPHLAKFLGPVYAVGAGIAVGAISRTYDVAYDGIVLQAIGATMAVFVVMLVLYKTGIIKASPKFRKIVVGATIGVAVFYLVALVVNLAGGTVPFLNDASPIGILLSLGICALAASNLVLDFDVIDSGVEQGYPKNMEWVAALGLVITLVWLYLELLKLIGKFRAR